MKGLNPTPHPPRPPPWKQNWNDDTKSIMKRKSNPIDWNGRLIWKVSSAGSPPAGWVGGWEEEETRREETVDAPLPTLPTPTKWCRPTGKPIDTRLQRQLGQRHCYSRKNIFLHESPRQTQTHTHTNRQTDTQTDTQTDAQNEEKTNRETLDAQIYRIDGDAL